MRIEKNVFGWLLFAVLSLASANVPATPRYSATIAANGYRGTMTLRDFPVLVKFAEGQPTGFSYSQFQPGATDLTFTDVDGAPLNYELSAWNPGGTSFVWVRVPSLTAATKIVAHWGDSAATSAPVTCSPSATWADAGYLGVWHMDETAGQGTADYVALDASGNGLDATPTIGSANGDLSQMVSRADGVFGSARVNGAWNANVKGGNCLVVSGYADQTASVAAGGVFTISGWFNATVYNANARLWGQKASYSTANGWEVQQSGESRTTANTSPIAKSINNVADAPLNVWHHYAFVVRGTTEKSSFYLDGVEKGTSTLPALVSNGLPLVIANNTAQNEVAFSGSYDEVRFLRKEVSTDWVQAEYDMGAGTLCTVSAVVDAADGDTLTIAASNNEGGDVIPSWGRHAVAGGEVVNFSAPASENRLENGDYAFIGGYRRYESVNGVESLVAEKYELSGSYTHTAGAIDRIVWIQETRKGGALFATRFSSVCTVNYAGTEQLRHFPVLVRISEGSPEGFSYADCQPNGADVLFAGMDGGVFPHEIETWDPAGESFIWVNVPKLGSGTQFRFCYGNATVTTPQTVTGTVWADAGYVGVWHMAEATAVDAVDATGHGLDAAPAGAASAQMVGQEGVAGGARTVASTKVANKFSVPHSMSLNLGTSFTIGGWFKGTPNTNGRLFCKKTVWSGSDGWEIQFNNPPPLIMPRGSASDGLDAARSVPSPVDDWVFLVWTYDNVERTATTFANGVQVGSNRITPVVDNTCPLSFCGDQPFVGGIDEVRLTRGAVPVTRQKAVYDTMTQTNFVTMAQVVEAAGTDSFTVESTGGQYGEVTPAWGETEDLEDGAAVAFSAPSGVRVLSDELHYVFTGYRLFVTGADGLEHLQEEADGTSGTYTHVSGTSARLVWKVEELFGVTVVAEHASATGEGHYSIGAEATCAVTPDEGWRVVGWTVNGQRLDTRANSVRVIVTGTMTVVPDIQPIPSAVAFYGLAGASDGATVDRLSNELGNMRFTGLAQVVENVPGAGQLPFISSVRPASIIYGDASRETILVRDPSSLAFGPASGFASGEGGGAIRFSDLSAFIAGEDLVTVECFVHANSCKTAGDKVVWSADVGANPHKVFVPDSAPATVALAGGVPRVSVSGLAGMLDEAWHHVAVVYDKAEQRARLFVDYKECETTAALAIDPTPASFDFVLGAALACGDATANFTGHVSCLRVSRWALLTDDFMRMGYAVEGDDMVALFAQRGPAGTPVGTFRSRRGERSLTAVAETITVTGEKGTGAVALPTWSDEAPGESIYANAAALEAETPQPLVLRASSICFSNTNGTVGSYVLLDGLSSVVTSLDAFTVEFFAKHDSTTNFWRSVFSLNLTQCDALTGVDSMTPGGTFKASKIAMPGPNMGNITFQHPDIPIVMTPPLDQDDAWHHIALGYDGRRVHIFIDYREKGSVELARQATIAPAILGSSYGATGATGVRASESFNGLVSTLRVTKRLLDPEEFMVVGPRPTRGLCVIVQ